MKTGILEIHMSISWNYIFGKFDNHKIENFVLVCEQYASSQHLHFKLCLIDTLNA